MPTNQEIKDPVPSRDYGDDDATDPDRLYQILVDEGDEVEVTDLGEL